MTETKTDEKGDKLRYFPYGEAYAHIVGYNSKKYGKTGIEKKFNTTLLNKQDKTPIGELKKILFGSKVGLSAIAIIDPVFGFIKIIDPLCPSKRERAYFCNSVFVVNFTVCL